MQQQLYIYHINANINAKIKLQWKELGNISNNNNNNNNHSSDNPLVDNNIAA